MFTPNIPEGEKCITEPADLLRFFHTTVSVELTQNGAKSKNHLLSSGPVDGNALLMRRARGEWPDWFKLTATVIQITLHSYREQLDNTLRPKPPTPVCQEE